MTSLHSAAGTLEDLGQFTVQSSWSGLSLAGHEPVLQELVLISRVICTGPSASSQTTPPRPGMVPWAPPPVTNLPELLFQRG